MAKRNIIEIGRYISIGLCLFCILTDGLANEPVNGKYAIKNYENLFPFLNSYSIWSSAQSKEGVMYFGAEEHLLEYDGVRWKAIPFSKNTPLRSMCFDSTGILYIGSVNDLGYIDTRSDTVSFVSLCSHLPEKSKNFEDVWNTYIIKDKVYYITQKNIMEWDGVKFTLYPTAETYHKTSVIDSTLWFIQKDRGVSVFKNGSVRILKNSDFFKDKISEGIITYSNESHKILIGTRNHGLYLCTYNDTALLEILPFNPDLNQVLGKAKLYGIQTLSQELFVLSTLKDGVFIINLNGEIEKHITIFNGLNSNTIYSLYHSSDDILWITTSRGVSKMLLNSPIINWDADFGIDGVVLSIIRYKNALRIGTLVGLFDYQPQASSRYETFVRRTEKITAVWELYNFQKDPHNEDLLIGATEGLFKFDGENYQQIAPYRYVRVICQSSQKPGFFYTGDNDGVGLIKYQHGVYKNMGRIGRMSGKVNSIEEVDEQTLLVSLMHQGLYLVQLGKDIDHPGKQDINTIHQARITHIESPLVSNENLNVFKYNEKFIITSSNKIFLYNPVSRQIEKNNYMGKKISEYNHDITAFSVDTRGNIWIGGNVLFIRRPDDTYDIFNLSFPQISTPAKASRFFHEEDGKTWIGGEEGLFLLNAKELNLKESKGFNTLIRFVSSLDDKHVIQKYSIRRKIIIPPGQRSVTFEYCAPFFVDETSMEYAYYLQGHDTQWSSWSKMPSCEYSYLPAGKYVFQVKSRNIFNEESNVEQLSFRVRPHWYCSGLFYGMLVCLVSILLIFFGPGRRFMVWTKNKIACVAGIFENTPELPVGSIGDSIDTPENPLLSKARRCIEAQLHNSDYTINDFTKDMAMSHTNLYRKIKTLTGLSISAYINRIRLEKAAELLRENDANIAAVSYAVGFSDPAYFTRCFKKHFGMPPSNYLKIKAKK